VIYDASTFELPMRIEADLCIVGSGAGGSAAAAVAAEAGLSVVILEAGGFVPPSVMNQREKDMLPELLYANGSQTTSDRGCTIIQGRALGGSTVHNINLCKRIPDAILDEWQQSRTLKHLDRDTWNKLYDEVEQLLDISPIEPGRWNRHNRLLEAGTNKLGWRGGGLDHNRTGCIGSGFCEVGCAYDAKNNAVKVFVPRAVEADAQFLTHCRAIKVLHQDGQVSGVKAAALDPTTREPLGDVTIEAKQVCLSASATGTPAILIRSDVPDPSGETGNNLRIHPALVAAGEFDEPVRLWKGIPQAYECTEYLDFEAVHPAADSTDKDATKVGLRTWLIAATAHPVSTSTFLPGWGKSHRRLMERYDHMAIFTGMIHDQTPGTVAPAGELGVDIEWSPNRADRRELAFGLARSAELLFAAGARRVFIPTDPVRIFERGDSLAELEDIDPRSMGITAVHPMSTVPMGDDPQKAAVDSRGKHHHVEGLWVADGSLFPTSIGVPPQMSIYAMGLHVGRSIAHNFGQAAPP
jgi:choline dehydrogenase-like flavoprotein